MASLLKMGDHTFHSCYKILSYPYPNYKLGNIKNKKRAPEKQ